MKRGTDRRWTVDWAGDGAPDVGHVVRHVSEKSVVDGYWRVTSVRLVRHRKPLEPGYSARYRMTAQHLGEKLPDGVAVDWTLHAHRRPRCAPRAPDRFSPLLEAES